VFYEASRDLDSQPPPRTDHVEACRPQGCMYVLQSSRPRIAGPEGASYRAPGVGGSSETASETLAPPSMRVASVPYCEGGGPFGLQPRSLGTYGGAGYFAFPGLFSPLMTPSLATLEMTSPGRCWLQADGPLPSAKAPCAPPRLATTAIPEQIRKRLMLSPPVRDEDRIIQRPPNAPID
jgi:hypothetical protein